MKGNKKMIENAMFEKEKHTGSEDTLPPVIIKGSVSRLSSVNLPLERYDNLIRTEAIIDLVQEVRQRSRFSDFETFVNLVFPKIDDSMKEGDSDA